MKDLVDIRNTVKATRAHSLIIDNREKMSITGVSDVQSFNETEVILETDAGGITVFGQGLHISKLNLDEGQLVIDGFIEGVEYVDAQLNKGGFFSRLFR